MNNEDFRRHGHTVIDWLADYYEKVESLPVQSRAAPGDLRRLLPPHPPENGEDFEGILKDMDRLILPGITHWQSPRFFAYFPANVSPPSVLGELLSAGLGVQGMLWATSPACTELESHIMDWLVEALELPRVFRSDAAGGGVIQDSASSATLCALLAARERKTSGLGNRRGCDGTLVAYASSQAHSSIEKDCRIAGIGSDNLRLIDVDERFALNPDKLEQRIRADIDAGLTPFFVCACVGTTSTLALDPVPAIAELCGRYGLWLHVDAAMAGTAALCPEHRGIHEGIESADSYTFNPHKWMLTNFDCNAFFVADRQALTNALGILPEYLKTAATDEVIDYRDWQIPLGRRFRALKLWFVLRSYGLEGLRAMVRRHIELANEFAQWIEDGDDFEMVTPRSLNLICFRYKSDDAFNERLLQEVNRSGEIYISHTRLNGRYVLRLCVGQANTQRQHLEQAWQCLQTAARDLQETGRVKD
ncbi:MAG: pyridoxal-dependent decarboxylase [Gammaproteobacteria bacterium]